MARLPYETQEAIYEGWVLHQTVSGAARHAGVSTTAARRYIEVGDEAHGIVPFRTRQVREAETTRRKNRHARNGIVQGAMNAAAWMQHGINTITRKVVVDPTLPEGTMLPSGEVVKDIQFVRRVGDAEQRVLRLLSDHDLLESGSSVADSGVGDSISGDLAPTDIAAWKARAKEYSLRMSKFVDTYDGNDRASRHRVLTSLVDPASQKEGSQG